MPEPLVSILVPTFEPKGEHLYAALESIEKQTLRNWTVLIHDDASSADVRSIMAPYLADPRFTFTRSSQRLGIGGNWNACLREARERGNYIQFLFQDDLWHPEYLERSVAVLERHPEAGFSAAHHDYVMEADDLRAPFYRSLQVVKERGLKPGLQEHGAFLQWWTERGLSPNVIGEPSFVLLRRSLVADVGRFNERLPQALDLEYWLRCLLRTDWYYIGETLGTFRVHPAGASAAHDRAGEGLTDRLRCLALLLDRLPAGDLRKIAARSSSRAIAGMIGKYRSRKREGKHMGAGGKKQVLRFCARHPLITVRGAWSYLSPRSPLL